MIKISPSMLAADFGNLREQISQIEKAGAEMLHVDIMDGHFVPNITIGPLFVEHIKRITSLPLDVHLMIENPSAFVDDFVKAGADIITIHIETDKHILRTLDVIKTSGKKAGITLNPATPLNSIKYAIKEADLLLIMSVNPGFGGQSYIDAMDEKIVEAKKMIMETGNVIDLEVDGGIKATNVKKTVDSGANIVVMGTEIFHSGNYAQKIKEVREILGE